MTERQNSTLLELGHELKEDTVNKRFDSSDAVVRSIKGIKGISNTDLSNR